MKKTSYYGLIWRQFKRNKVAMICMGILFAIVLVACLASVIYPEGFDAQNISEGFAPFSLKHPLGTDNFGRDLLCRIIYGARYTLIIGFGVATGSMILGVGLGLLAGMNKKLDFWLMRLVDIMMGIPSFTLNLCLVMIMGKDLKYLMIALIVTSIPNFARVVRVQVLSVEKSDFIEASMSLGASKSWLAIKHIVPNCISPILVQYTFSVGSSIMAGASLGFIGWGVQLPTPEWGVMISAGKAYIRAYWPAAIIPGIALIIVSYALNLFGDGLRDALDPRLKQ